MRLLQLDDEGAISLVEFHFNIPPYAILSHTWGADEVNYEDVVNGISHHGRLPRKIRFCADQAQRDGLSHFWIDTCCIDQSNSEEVREAINAMFRWYQDAARCYVFLADVSTTSDVPNRESAFESSRWFTRGWTLPELLAPESVEFFSADNTRLGDKRSLEQAIVDATGIPVDALRGRPLSGFSVSDKLAWAHHRQTTRKEDKAYALLGLFDVQIPLLYGEGEEAAFYRLVEAINKPAQPSRMPIVKGAAFDSHAEEHEARCHPSTRVGLLGEIEDWVADSAAKPIFWLSGTAGTGKSTVARSVAQRFHDRGILAASFFFKRDETDRGAADKLFTTLAAQLAARVPWVARHIRTAIETDSDLPGRSFREQFEKLICEPLARLRSPQTLVMVMDALDECHQDADVEDIIHLLSQLEFMPLVRLRIFLTSWPELPIRHGFTNIHGNFQNFILDEMPSPVIEHDIRVFLVSELARIRSDYNIESPDDMQLPLDWPDQHVETLVRMAAPLFILATTICRFIGDAASSSPIDQLGKLLKCYDLFDSDVSRLDSTYLAVLEQLVIVKTGHTREEVLVGVRDIVGPIILLIEPLSANNLSQLLDTPLDIILGHLRNLHSVIDVPSNADVLIRTLHLSFCDLLTSPLHKDSNEFWIDYGGAHANLATQCIQVLSGKSLRKDICNLGAPGANLLQIDQGTLDTCLPPPVQYSCLHWAHHLEKIGIRIADGGQVQVFLETHFLHWLEALCILGKIRESVATIDTLRRLVQPGTKLEAFLRDADRFIQNCMPIIVSQPLQLYSSGIIFSPKHSIIRKKFYHELPGWIAEIHNIDLEWDPCIRDLWGHEALLHCVAFSYDDKLIASASSDLSAKIWDAKTGICLHTLRGHEYEVVSVAFSPDAGKVASASWDGTIKTWDTRTGTQLGTLEGHDDWVLQVIFSPDGTLIASASKDRSVKLWDAETGCCLRTLTGHDSCVISVAFLCNGSQVAAGSRNAALKLWDTRTGALLQTLQCGEGRVSAMAFAPDRTRFACLAFNGTLSIWDMHSRLCIRSCINHDEIVNGFMFSPDCEVYMLAFAPDGARLASGSRDRTVKIWDAQTGDCIQTFEKNDNRVYSVAFSSDGAQLASGSGDDLSLWSDDPIKIWDTRAGPVLQNTACHAHTISTLRVSPTGAKVISISKNDGKLKAWDTRTGAHLYTLDGYHTFTFVMFSANGSQFLVKSGSYFKALDSQNGHDCAVDHTVFPPSLINVDSDPPSRDGVRCASVSDDSIDTPDTEHWKLTDSSDRITRNNQDMLWLPMRYRPRCDANMWCFTRLSNTLVVGSESGRVWMIRFSADVSMVN